MTTPTDDELLRLCEEGIRYERINPAAGKIARALKSRLTSQSRDEVERSPPWETWDNFALWLNTRTDQVREECANICDRYKSASHAAKTIRALKSTTK